MFLNKIWMHAYLTKGLLIIFDLAQKVGSHHFAKFYIPKVLLNDYGLHVV